MTYTKQLTPCDSEPIHLLSKIRQNGFLFVLTHDDFKILQVSQNISKLINQEPTKILNNQIDTIFDNKFKDELSKSIYYVKKYNKQFASFNFTFEDKTLFSIVHSQDDFFILEIEDQSNHRGIHYSVEDSINTIIKDCDYKTELVVFLQRIVNSVKTISNYDRVMLYKFDDNFNGEVLAQVTSRMHENFLGHRFPSSDIPVQARALYLKNKFRVIENVNDESSLIIPSINPLTNTILDMTYCCFRSVSLMHIEYLKNMGVESSMSLSIIVNGKLWGLVACHHDKPKYISIQQNQTYYLLSELISSQIEQKELIKYYENSFELKSKRELLINSLQNDEESNFFKSLEKYKKILNETIKSDGCVIYFENQFFGTNDVFDKNELNILFLICKENLKNNIFVNSNLSNDYPNLLKLKKKLGGLIALKIPNIEDAYLIYFRFEQIHTVKWAGEKSKKIEYDKDGNAIMSPRASFESWKEVVKGTCEQFSKEEIESTKQLVEQLSKIYTSYSINKEAKDLKNLNQKLQIQAHTDPLTLLYNQRYLKEYGIKYFIKAQKEDKNFSLILIDIDNLKIIKEQYGNETCDLLIMNTVNSTKRVLEKEKTIFSRVGCEEFAIMVFESDFKQSLTIANQIKKTISETPINLGTIKIYANISMGISNFDKNAFNNFSQMVRATEIKLSLAQDSGGNIINY